ncbi:MAG: Nif3-like dinuclear metal center hexameric protein [Flavobacteriales bacterium]|nr:Nif3-like dinuclear metal center hexameric protein [Flavobacteriales bacterium]
MKLKQITSALEQIAPLSLQEKYDNSGLIVGSSDQEVNGVLVSLDCTEEVIQEAIDAGCNMVIAHHPIVFSGLKRFNGKSYVERAVMKAIKHDVALYAIHTNLDNVDSGVNNYLCELLGIRDPKILSPKSDLMFKLVTFVPEAHKEEVMTALFAAGAGAIGNYSECSFSSQGEGTFKANEKADPHVGEQGKRHIEPEFRLEMVFESWKKGDVLNALKSAHPYEEVAFDVLVLDEKHKQVGSGMVGELDEAMELNAFFDRMKDVLGVSVVKHTAQLKEKVKRIAVCGGSGFFLLNAAKSSKADVFVTSDVKYHEFFDAEKKLVLADIGHWESEHRTIELIQRILNEKFATFAVHLSKTNTNPVKYY